MAQCVAPIKTKAWYSYDAGRTRYVNEAKRCSSKAQEGSIFCGVHKDLANCIESIVWKSH